jgi:hypothetical protein
VESYEEDWNIGNCVSGMLKWKTVLIPKYIGFKCFLYRNQGTRSGWWVQITRSVISYIKKIQEPILVKYKILPPPHPNLGPFSA